MIRRASQFDLILIYFLLDGIAIISFLDDTLHNMNFTLLGVSVTLRLIFSPVLSLYEFGDSNQPLVNTHQVSDLGLCIFHRQEENMSVYIYE